MLYYLSELRDHLQVLNVFQYQTFRAAGAGLTAFVFCLLFGNRVILKLTSLKVGQPIRTKEEVHRLAELHGGKGGTPTMGGILIIGALLTATLLWARPTNPFIWALVFTTLGLGALGFMDDYLKVTRKKSAGASGKMKLIVQFIVAIIAVGIVYFEERNAMAQAGEAVKPFISAFYVPFMKDPLIKDMGLFTFVLLPVIIVGASNAVNLTDGLDGLAAGCTVSVAFAYALFTYVAGHSEVAEYLLLPHNQHSGEVAVFCAALIGSGLGFLWFNCHPARVFMGDTGSLALGGILGMVAICCKQELLLAVVGGVFVIEALSVILQVGSFKLTGKRIFKMAPIHHHFELMGWSESRVIIRFWIVSIMFALFGLMTLKLR